MRYLVLYAASSGLLAAAIITSPASIVEVGEPMTPDDMTNWGIADHDGENNATAIIGLPEGDFRPNMVDADGDEIGVRFIDFGGGSTVGVGGPDAAITRDDGVDNTAANNG